MALTNKKEEAVRRREREGFPFKLVKVNQQANIATNGNDGMMNFD